MIKLTQQPKNKIEPLENLVLVFEAEAKIKNLSNNPTNIIFIQNYL